MKSLLWWWPTQERLNEILISDAEAHSPAVALAVHQRMHILRRRYSELIDTRNAEPVDESALLARVVEPVGDGCQITLIEGKSGTGKSHVVRWLEIQLARRQDQDTRVVLFVSKGSRLRDIVKKLCERPELDGAQNAELRQQLNQAQEPIEVEDAAARLCNQLAFVCEQRAKEAATKQERGQVLSELEKLQKKWGHPAQLPHILVYRPLRPILTGENSAMRRLVEHLHSSTGALEVRRDQEFLESDLAIETFPDDLDQKAKTVLGNLENADWRREAVRVLNDALDDAKRILLGLNPGVVQEVFASIRHSLLTQNKELVLLVEDFADLSGMQKEVLQASIETGMGGGTKSLCTLRTVLAFTDNFIHKEQTVLSRAQHVYYVPSSVDDDLAVKQSIGLVASYLRAARSGSSELERAMRERAPDEVWHPTPPQLPAGDDEVLKAFGESDGIELFPFTPRVVERMVRDHYEGAQAVLFVPRDIIKVIMPRLLQHRHAFERGEFPTVGFKPNIAAQLTTEQSEWLRRVNATGGMHQRLERFVLYWGLNAGAARAFGLPVPDVTDRSSPARLRRTVQSSVQWVRRDDASQVSIPIVSPPKPVSVELFAEEVGIFEIWRKDGISDIGLRRDIRKAIDDCVRAALAWAWSPRIDKSTQYKTRWPKWNEGLNIDGLRLADDVTPITLVTAEERADKVKNEHISRELAAIVGAGRPGFKNWDTDGVEIHLAAHLSFLEQHRPTVEQHLLATWRARRWEALPFLVNSLILMAAVLGVPNAGSMNEVEFIDALFAEPPEHAETEWSREWLQPLRQLHQPLCELLEREVGAFQGTGGTIHGVDAGRLAPFMVRLKDGDAGLSALPEFPPGARTDEDIQNILKANEVLRSLAQQSRTEIDARREVAERMRSFLGNEVDKDGLLSALKSTLKELTELRAVSDDEVTQVKTATIALRKAPVVESLRAIEHLADRNASAMERLEALGNSEHHAGALSKAHMMLQLLDHFLTQKEGLIHDDSTIDPLDEAEKAHTDQLKRVRTLLDVASNSESIEQDEASG